MSAAYSLKGHEYTVQLFLGIKMYASVSGPAVGANFFVLRLLSLGHHAEVRASVIQAITVLVVDFQLGGDGENEPVHYDSPAIGFAHRVALRTAVPPVPANHSGVLRVHARCAYLNALSAGLIQTEQSHIGRSVPKLYRTRYRYLLPHALAASYLRIMAATVPFGFMQVTAAREGADVVPLTERSQRFVAALLLVMAVT
jgi:hypothetical protein